MTTLPDATADLVIHDDTAPEPTELPDTVPMYSAELVWRNGKYLLTVHDHLTNTVHTTRLTTKAVDRLPGYLTLLTQTSS